MTEKTFIATAKGEFSGQGLSYPCVLGRGGVIDAAEKREGDGASPLGTWRMKRVFYRPDRLARPETGLPVVPLRETDGWCDAPGHPLYNRPVSLPFSASHEKLWREDHAYDLIVASNVLHATRHLHWGSAVFFHLSHEDNRATQGCVAITRPQMLDVLKLSDADTHLAITL